jgi:hypothetical protein
MSPTGDHVGGHCPRRPAEAHKRHRRRQILAYARDGFVHRCKRCMVELISQSTKRRGVLQSVKPRPFALHEAYALTEGMRNEAPLALVLSSQIGRV